MYAGLHTDSREKSRRFHFGRLHWGDSETDGIGPLPFDKRLAEWIANSPDSCWLRLATHSALLTSPAHKRKSEAGCGNVSFLPRDTPPNQIEEVPSTEIEPRRAQTSSVSLSKPFQPLTKRSCD